MKSKKDKDSKIKLHLGCGNNYLNDWINIDNMLDKYVIKLDINWNFKTPLPFKKHCVDIIYDREFLGRLEQGPKFIKSLLSCFKHILKEDGVLKVGLYDMDYKPKIENWLKNLGFKNLEFCATVEINASELNKFANV